MIQHCIPAVESCINNQIDDYSVPQQSRQWFRITGTDSIMGHDVNSKEYLVFLSQK